MSSLRQFSSLFCASCLEITLHKAEQCIHCTKDRPAPTGSWVNSPIGFDSNTTRHRRKLAAHGPALTIRAGQGRRG